MKKKRIKWTKAACIKEAKKYKKKVDWRRANISSQQAARKKGWMAACSAHMMSTSQALSEANSKWTKEDCIKEAKKFKTRAAWYYNSVGCYAVAARRKWINECATHMLSRQEAQSIGNTVWTKDLCIKESKKYRTRNAWCVGSQGSYDSARRNGWVELCVNHMISTSQALSEGHQKWTKADCLKTAKKCKTRNEWIKRFQNHYASARHNGWLKECYADFPECATGTLRELKCYPLYRKTFKKLKIPYQFQARLSRRSLIEFVITTPEGSFGIEVKHDKSFWIKAEIKAQLQKYTEDGKSSKYRLKGIVLTSPKGKYGCSLKELADGIKTNTLAKLLKKQRTQLPLNKA